MPSSATIVASQTLVDLIVLGIAAGLSIALVVIGALNMENCPMRDQMPLWAVIHGSIGIALVVVGPAAKAEKAKGEKGPATGLTGLLAFVYVGTWIWGMVLAFPCADECPDGCYIHLYKLALAATCIPWAILTYILLASCCRVAATETTA